MIKRSNSVDLFINKVMDYMTDDFILVEMSMLSKNYETLSELFFKNSKKGFKIQSLPSIWKNIVQLAN